MMKFNTVVFAYLAMMLARMSEGIIGGDDDPTFTRCGISSTDNFVNWSELIETDAPVVYPTSTDEVINYVNQARTEGCRIRPKGTGHSFTPVVTHKDETDVIVMSLADYVPPGDWDKKLDTNLKRVRMSAGATQIEFIRFVRRLGYTCKTCTGTPNFTLGGVFMNPSVHGSALGEDRYPSLLTGLLAVDGMGNLIEVGEDDIQDWRGSLGLLGIVLAVEFEVKEDLGLEKIVREFTFAGDDWNQEAITGTIRDELDEKLSFGLSWDYYSGRFKIITDRVVGREFIDIDSAEAHYDEVIASTPNLAKDGGPKDPILEIRAIWSSSIFGGASVADYAFNSDESSGIYDGFGEIDFTAQGAAVHNIDSFIPCPNECIEDGKIFEVLDASRRYFDESATYRFPGFFCLLRLIDVAADTMTLENLLPGRYISIEYAEVRYHDRIDQPFYSFLQGLQATWDKLGNFQGSFHLGKEYGYGPLGDLPGVIPFQDEAILNRFYDAATREAFINATRTYDPLGVFMGGSGARLLGLTDVDFDPRRSNFEESISTSTSCDRLGNVECASGCCEDGGLFFDSQCTALVDLPQGSECDFDCDCASGQCNKFLFFFGGSCE